MKRITIITCAVGVLALVALGFLCRPAHAASVWEALSFSVGGQGRWLDGGGLPSDRSFEGAGNGALSLTPHVSVTGGISYGFDDSYVRSHVDARVTATDAADPGFNVWVGAGRYFAKHDSDGLDEAAGKAGIGWAPFRDANGNIRPWILGATAAYGLDSDRRQITVSAVYSFKITRGAQ